MLTKVVILNNKSVDDRIWIKLKSPEILNKENNEVFCCFCYIPPGDSTATLNEASQWSTFQAEVEEYATRGKVILCGDLNARTGNCNDFIAYDSDLPVRSSFRYIVDSAIPRTSKDTTVNTQGRYLLDLCISSRIRIVNGRLDGDSHGGYTCYTPRGCSVVDYALVSADMLQEVLYFKVEDLPIYSDHFPIVLSVKHGHSDGREEEDQQYSAAKYNSLVESVRWNEEIQANFREPIEESATIQMIVEIQSEVDQDNVNASAKKVETLLKTIIKRAGGASIYI